MFVDFQQPPASTTVQQADAGISFDAAYARAREHANGGQPELALAEYGALLARSPGNADVLLGRGVVFSRLERWPEAEADLTAAARAAPDYPDVWAALADLYRWSGRPEQALAAYDRLIALQPDEPAHRAARAAVQGEKTDDAPLIEPTPAPRAASPDATIAAGYSWLASLSSNWLDVGDTPRWNEQTLAVRHYMRGGSLAFETLRAHRFERTGHAWALDAYVDLWRGAYANLRYQKAPGARLFPANAGRVDLYQALGRGWELSLSDDVLGFDGRVNIYGVGLARYVGNFYVQLRHQNIVSEGSHASGDRLLGRWYYRGDADSYAELRINRGRSDDALSLSGGRTRSGGGGIEVQHYFTRDWGARLGASFTREGSAGARERGVSLALYRRW
ncbi:YaiO family outer membrane beta-barrel protein [Massilia sp. YIM B02443]|uniref:YaiO family outer membrane beta-barrel protein n=1 Tax=Massilia sp. YIM B02443 TaxID=3050127 RepID=UPI0025B726A2|nr:YaiO family outer membrane beta-barrel protein [Massilia sp. YIM B02443]MDN4035866.1 YaiO family outer membrane beta-barrel protein [Massilia sp. YIM B02443]